MPLAMEVAADLALAWALVAHLGTSWDTCCAAIMSAVQPSLFLASPPAFPASPASTWEFAVANATSAAAMASLGNMVVGFEDLDRQDKHIHNNA